MPLNIRGFKPNLLNSYLDSISSEMLERRGGHPCGGKKFFDYHPGATIDDFSKRFEYTHEEAVEKIKSFNLGYQREKEIIGYGFSKFSMRNFQEKSFANDDANRYSDSNNTNITYTAGIGFILYLLRNIGSYTLMKGLYYNSSEKQLEKKVNSLIEFLYQFYQKDIERYLMSKEVETEEEIPEEEKKKRFLRLLLKLKELTNNRLKDDETKMDNLTEDEIEKLSIVLHDFWLLIQSNTDIDKEFMNFMKDLPVEQVNVPND